MKFAVVCDLNFHKRSKPFHSIMSTNPSLRVYLEQSSSPDGEGVGNIECSLESTAFPAPPTKYVCPLSNELMTDPVQIPGCKSVSFERRHAESWLLETTPAAHVTTRRKRKVAPISPYTGHPVTIKELVANRTLKWKIDSWRKQREYSIRQYMRSSRSVLRFRLLLLNPPLFSCQDDWYSWSSMSLLQSSRFCKLSS